MCKPCHGLVILGYTHIEPIPNPNNNDSLFWRDDTMIGAKGIVLSADKNLITDSPVLKYEWKPFLPGSDQHLDPYVGANADAMAFGGKNSSRIFIRTHDTSGNPIQRTMISIGCEITTQDGTVFAAQSTTGVPTMSQVGTISIDNLAAMSLMVTETNGTHPLEVDYQVIATLPTRTQMERVGHIQEFDMPNAELSTHSIFQSYHYVGGVKTVKNTYFQTSTTGNTSINNAFTSPDLFSGFHEKSELRVTSVKISPQGTDIIPSIYPDAYLFANYNQSQYELKTVFSYR